MRPEVIDWDDDDDPAGNVRHIAASDLTRTEVEEVLDAPDGPAQDSQGAPEGTGRRIVFGWTSTGRHIAVIYDELCEDPYIVRPVTAYDVPEYAEGD
jgi:hypothetical protein